MANAICMASAARLLAVARALAPMLAVLHGGVPLMIDRMMPPTSTAPRSATVTLALRAIRAAASSNE
jgi:hypothetical protein